MNSANRANGTASTVPSRGQVYHRALSPRTGRVANDIVAIRRHLLSSIVTQLAARQYSSSIEKYALRFSSNADEGVRPLSLPRPADSPGPTSEGPVIRRRAGVRN